MLKTLLLLGSSLALAKAQDQDFEFAGSNFNFKCPEPNGLFPDPEQCDLYYVCEDNVAKPELCEDGLLFDDSQRNHERCKLPHGIECGKREFVQEPQAGIDPRCPRANGIFDHEDPKECKRFYLCDKGVAHEMPCVSSLVFDISIGSCVREEELSPEGKICPRDDDGNTGGLKTIEGFTCPGKETIGPQGLLQAHPVFPHPTDCQFFFTCFFGKEPNKFGCSKGQVFDSVSLTCKDPVDVPECGCWYDCGEDSKCPGSCNADCSCPSANFAADQE